MPSVSASTPCGLCTRTFHSALASWNSFWSAKVHPRVKCNIYLCLSSTHINISGSARKIYHSEIYHTKSTALREISHGEIYHREPDLPRNPPPPICMCTHSCHRPHPSLIKGLNIGTELARRMSAFCTWHIVQSTHCNTYCTPYALYLFQFTQVTFFSCSLIFGYAPDEHVN